MKDPTQIVFMILTVLLIYGAISYFTLLYQQEKIQELPYVKLWLLLTIQE